MDRFGLILPPSLLMLKNPLIVCVCICLVEREREREARGKRERRLGERREEE